MPFPGAAGEGDLEGVVIVEDPANDVRMGAPASSQGAAGDPRHLDVVAMTIGPETTTSIPMSIRLATWAQPAPFGAEGGRRLTIEFELSQRLFSVNHPYQSTGSDCSVGQVYVVTENPASLIQCVESFAIDEQSATLQIDLPKQLLQDENGTAIQSGSVLHNIVGRAFQGSVNLDSGLWDRVPDSGSAPEFVARVFDGRQSGDLFLRTLYPTRASNGEATTFVFEAALENRGTSEKTVLFETDNDNPEWTVRLPSRLNIGAKTNLTFPVILSMNFSHAHGEADYFLVRASTPDNAHFAELRLGVHWLDIPQPAGHHNKLWLHSAPFPEENCQALPCSVHGFRHTWMNTQEKDPSAETTDVGGSQQTSTGSIVQWLFPLSPYLQTGLDFDLNYTASLHTAAKFTVPANIVRSGADLLLCEWTPSPAGNGTCPFGAAGKVLAQGLGPKGAVESGRVFELPIEIDVGQEADLVPFQTDVNLVLRVWIESDRIQVFPGLGREPTVLLRVSESVLTLPLIDYHDPVEQRFSDVGALAVVPIGSSERLVNPGEGIRFGFDIRADGATERQVQVEIIGQNAAWATASTLGLRLAPGQRERVEVVISAPADAGEGERAELFLVAQDQNDPNVVALSRIRATVVDVDTLDIPDDLAEVREGGDTPGLGPGLLFATLFVTALTRPKRSK